MSKWQPEHQYAAVPCWSVLGQKMIFFCVWWLQMRLGFIIMSQRIKLKCCQWVGPGSPRPKKFKMQPSAVKVMATVFWDAKGVIMLDFLPKRSTMTGVYYANLLDQLRTAIREKHWGILSKRVLLQQGNARVHSCKVAMDAVEGNVYELIPHPA